MHSISNEKFLSADSRREQLARAVSGRKPKARARSVGAQTNAGGQTTDAQMNRLSLCQVLSASCFAPYNARLLERPKRTCGVPLQKGGIWVRQMGWGVSEADTGRVKARAVPQWADTRNVHGGHP